jgi:hypothetical protein
MIPCQGVREAPNQIVVTRSSSVRQFGPLLGPVGNELSRSVVVEAHDLVVFYYTQISRRLDFDRGAHSLSAGVWGLA